MIGRRAAAMVALSATAIALATLPAMAALREVAVGNFYYDDATPGDGRVEANQGDQLRFTLYDGGPGTPHTVEVDELGIHSGSLAAGETFTTPPLDQPGTYRLYCKPHQNRGHEAILVVGASAAPPTAPPATPPPATAPPATAPPGTAPPGAAAPGTTRPGAAAPTTSLSPDGAVGLPGDAPTTTPGSDAPASGADPTVAPTGRGQAGPEALAARPVDPDSLEAALGRPTATKGPWTRSVRLAFVVLALMIAAASYPAFRSRSVRPSSGRGGGPVGGSRTDWSQR